MQGDAAVMRGGLDNDLRQQRDADPRGDAGEDRSQGYSLAHDPAMRAQQEQFLRFAREDPELFARLLRESANAKHRAIAATVVGYAADKAWAARELEAAAFDADGNVRNKPFERSQSSLFMVASTRKPVSKSTTRGSSSC